MTRTAALAAMIAGIAALPANVAAETAWMGVGTLSLSAQTGTQTYEVRGTNVVREIMFCVDGANVQLVGADVRFRGGESQMLSLRTRVRAGACSRVFGLRNRTAELGSVVLTYDPASLAGHTPSLQVLVR
jgi:hypothetical protein